MGMPLVLQIFGHKPGHTNNWLMIGPDGKWKWNWITNHLVVVDSGSKIIRVHKIEWQSTHWLLKNFTKKQKGQPNDGARWKDITKVIKIHLLEDFLH